MVYRISTNLLKRLWVGITITLLLSACTISNSSTALPDADALAMYQNVETRPLVFAYYYIWFDPTSWHRAKTDYPLLGNYSSFDRFSMRKHIRWAKAAGIDAFIISWKSSDKLNERLASIIKIAQEEDFKLALLYQGLDFEREAIPAEKIASDLEYFVETYQDHPVFDIYEQPLVIWAGTWKFSAVEIENITREVRDDVLLLASERNLEGYSRIVDLVDGNAYYWGALNPDTYPNYPGKLIEMSDFVHSHDGLWVAPATPGFDARLVGGTSIVERQDGEMLKRQLAGSIQSNPDAVGIISWNEFSENSHIEPSTKYGTQYIEDLATILGKDLDKLAAELTLPERRPALGVGYSLPLLFIVFGMLVLSTRNLVKRYRGAKYPAHDGYQSTIQTQ